MSPNHSYGVSLNSIRVKDSSRELNSNCSGGIYSGRADLGVSVSQIQLNNRQRTEEGETKSDPAQTECKIWQPKFSERSI